MTDKEKIVEDDPSQEEALAFLLSKDKFVWSSMDYSWNGKTIGHSVFLRVNCSDIFAWACSDAEDLPENQILPLYKMVKADPHWGDTKWCCMRRNQKPQPPVEKMMREAGAWDEMMDKLGPNTMDAETRAIFSRVAEK